MKHPYPRYRPSEMEWLGDVPEDWDVKRLKFLASTNDDSLSEKEDPLRAMTYVDIGSVDSSYGITQVEEMVFEDAPSRARRLVLDGDTIISTVRTYLRAIAPICNPHPEMVVSTGFAVVRPRGLESRFATWALREHRFVEEIVAHSTGVSYPAINAAQIGNLAIPFPPPAEQRTIAAFLDRETVKVDALIAKKHQLIERLAEYRAALITRTVTKGLPPDVTKAEGFDPSPRLKPSGVEWLGEVPEHWNLVRLGRLGFFFKGGGGTKEDEIEGGLPCIRYGDLYTQHQFSIRQSRSGIAEASTSKYKRLRYGDLLFAGSGETIEEIGKSAVNLIEGPAYCGGDVIGFRPSVEVDATFFGYAADCPSAIYQKACMGRGVTVMHIYSSELKHLVLPLPPIREQQAIAVFLDRQMERISTLGARVEAAIERLHEFRSALITAAVTGKIDVRDCEPANTGVSA